MFQKKEDLRINNTKNYIFDAFSKLLKVTDYSNISISMIIKKAGVGRTTFYRHFYTKDDIILSKLNFKTIDLIERLNEEYDLTIYNKDIAKKVQFFFEYWAKNPEIIQIIIDLNKINMLYTTWSQSLIEMFSTIEMGLPTNKSQLYAAHFAIGGLTSILIQWFKNNRKESVEFISKHFNIPN